MPEQQHREKVTKNLSFRIALDLWKRLGVFARERETSVQAVVVAAAEEYLNKHESTKPADAADAAAQTREKALEAALTKPTQNQ